MSPGQLVEASPQGSRTYPEFAGAVKEWLLRKFVPRPSAAKPRPYSAVDLSVGRGGDLGRWDKSKCAYLVGVGATAAAVEECRRRMAPQHETEMETEFVCCNVLKEDLVCTPPPPLPHGLGGCIWMPLVNGTGNSPVSGTADPRSSQTGQVIRGLR